MMSDSLRRLIDPYFLRRTKGQVLHGREASHGNNSEAIMGDTGDNTDGENTVNSQGHAENDKAEARSVCS